jgi:phosphoglycolate phosphatase
MGAVGFDLDMTLIDSRPQTLAAFAALATDTGVAIDLDEVDRRLGIKLEDEIAYWFPEAEQAEAVAAYRRHYVAAAGATVALPGAARALATVRAAGDRTVIITAKHQISVEPCLLAAGLSADEVFTHVHGTEKADVLRTLAAYAYVGDSPPDMAAATSAGARAVGVSTGSFGSGALYAAGAEVVLASLVAFPAWFLANRLPNPLAGALLACTGPWPPRRAGTGDRPAARGPDAGSAAAAESRSARRTAKP